MSEIPRRVLSGNLAAMLALAASAPPVVEERELMPRPTIDLGLMDWARPSRGKPARRPRDRSRERMAKASRKRNRK